MARADEYREYAAECVRIAQDLQNLQERTTLLLMAEKWRELAEKIERQPR